MSASPDHPGTQRQGEIVDRHHPLSASQPVLGVRLVEVQAAPTALTTMESTITMDGSGRRLC